MKKPRNYTFYIILGLPVAVTIFLANQFELPGVINFLAGLVMTLYSMYVYFRPDNKKNDISSLASSFFLSGAFVILSTFFMSLPLWLIFLGFK